MCEEPLPIVEQFDRYKTLFVARLHYTGRSKDTECNLIREGYFVGVPDDDETIEGLCSAERSVSLQCGGSVSGRSFCGTTNSDDLLDRLWRIPSTGTHKRSDQK